MRKLQTTLTRIFIVLESESRGLSDFGQFLLKIETEISAKIGNSNAFLAQKQVISKKKKKKRSSPKLRLVETGFSAKTGYSNAFSGQFTTTTSHLRHPISFGGAVFIFSPKIGLKSTKNVRFCVLYRPMGKARPPLLATLLSVLDAVRSGRPRTSVENIDSVKQAFSRFAVKSPYCCQRIGITTSTVYKVLRKRL